MIGYAALAIINRLREDSDLDSSGPHLSLFRWQLVRGAVRTRIAHCFSAMVSQRTLLLNSTSAAQLDRAHRCSLDCGFKAPL